MTGAEITKQFERLARLTAATKGRDGGGDAWEFTFPDGETHRYVIVGLQSRSEVEDSLLSLLIWVWAVKNYLVERAKAVGLDFKSLEQELHADSAWLICADLANRAKHPNPESSKTGVYPRLGPVSFDVPQAALASLTFRAFEVETAIRDPRQVKLSVPVTDRDGRAMGDAFELTARAISTLERIRENLPA